MQKHISLRPRLFRIVASLTIISVTIFLNALVLSCSQTNKPADQQKILKVGMVLGSAGLGDRSFNDSAYNGLLEAQKQYNIRYDVLDFTSIEANVDALRLYSRNNYDLIIAVSFENRAGLESVAREFPHINFAAIDFEISGDNIASIVYREQEADFLMGVLGAMLSKTGSVAVIGGTDIPSIRRIMAGYKQGAVYQNANVKVTTDFAGTFSDPKVGFDLAMKRYGEGVDVIHNAASRTGLGIIEAAKQAGKLTTGTSGDQRYLAPGNVVGNRPKRVDTAVMLVIGEVRNNTFKAGVRSLGLKENGLMLGPFDESIVTKAMQNRLEELKQKIISGQIVVRTE